MKKQLEIAIVKANSATLEGCELYWLLSRSQLEFLFKEVEIFSSPPFVATAQYRETMLPVVSLEKYYGLEEKIVNGPHKYIVVRSVNEKNEMVKLIVQTVQTLKIHKLETGFASLSSPILPKNSEDILGIYSLANGKLGIVPDFVGLSRSLHWRGN
ncbi:MAG: chemotaxis protein CheW [Desulforhopalus sp.]